MTEAALKYFSHINLGPALSQHVQMTYMDAKNYLHITGDKYDVIINDADIPSYSGSAPLFGREHFACAREHLRPGGLVVSKLHLSGIPVSSFDSIVGTFLEVFPHVTVWFPATKPLSFFYLVGSVDEQCFSPRAIDAKLQQPAVLSSTEYMHWHSNMDLAMCYIGDEKSLRNYLRGYAPNSDYAPFVEFNMQQRGSGVLEAGFDAFLRSVRQPSLADHVDWAGMDSGQQADWLAAYDRHYHGATPILRMTAENNPFALLRCVLEGLSFLPQHAALREQEEKALTAFERGIASGQGQVVLGQIDAIAQEFPASGIPWMIKALALRSTGDTPGAAASADQALKLARAAGDQELVQRIGRSLSSTPASGGAGHPVLQPDLH